MALATNDRTGMRAVREATISFEEFLERCEGEHAEWVNGKVVAMAPIGDEHADLSDFLQMLLRHWAEQHDSGIVRSEPFVMKTGAALPGRSPDVLFLAKENLSRLKKSHIEGPADLAVEIISPDSRGRDRGEKFYEYEQGGVREYWLIDPERKQVEFYQRGEDGIYRLVGVQEGIYRSPVLPGLWLKIEWLWQRPLPPVLDVLRQWKLI